MLEVRNVTVPGGRNDRKGREGRAGPSFSIGVCSVSENFIDLYTSDEYIFLICMSVKSKKKNQSHVPFLPALPLAGLLSVLGRWQLFFFPHDAPILWVNL